MLEHFWHPVCAADQGPGPVPVRLLGRALVVAADDQGVPYVLEDRCLHRSTPLSLGATEPRGLRCAHHGWLWAPDGSCREVPGQPLDAVPRRARLAAFAARVVQGLVWTRLDHGADVVLPWPDRAPGVGGCTPVETVGALRRVEHLMEWVTPPWGPAVARAANPERRGGVITVELPAAPEPLGLAGACHTVARIHLPTTVQLTVRATGGRSRTLWATSVPVDAGSSCMRWWLTGDGVDAEAGDVVRARFAAAASLEAAKQPAELSLDRLGELSSRADRVSTAFRRGLEDLCEASRRGPQLLAAALRSAVA